MTVRRGDNRRVEGYEWISNRDLIDSAHLLMGNIDLDPASSEFANGYVGADKFFTAKDDPINEAQWFGKVYCFHPPACLYYNKREARWIPTRGLSPTLTSGSAIWWKTLKQQWLKGNVEQAIYFTNYIDLVMYSQDIFDHPVCILKSRPRLTRHYFGEEETDSRTTGASAVIYLQPKDNIEKATEDFCDIYGEKGRILL